MKLRFRHIAFGFFACSVFSASVYSQRNTEVNPDGYNTFYYPNGKVASEGLMRGGKPDGYWKTYYVTGVLKSEGNRRNSMLDSTWIFYTETADTLEIIHYQLGKKSGYSYRYETVTERNNVSRHYLKSKELYLDDKKEGQAFYYYPNGKVRHVGGYKNGKKQGTGKDFDENGTVVTLYTFHNDFMTSREFINRVDAEGRKTGTWKTFYDDGKVKDEETYRNGVLDGTVKIYSEKGNTINERSYREGRIIEEGIQMRAEVVDLITYYDDGVTLKRKGVYLDSIPVGRHFFYNRDGKPEKSVRYSAKGIREAEGPVDENEKREGEWKIYFETGELKSSGKYADDRQNGEWDFYFPTGKKEQTGNFRNGFMEGEWKWYFPSGNLLREETYVKGKPDGMSVQYSDSAAVVAKGEYMEGEREGPWVENAGDAREEGSYVMGLKNGMWKTYYKDGRLHHTGNFVQGNPDGRHVFYYPDGTLKEEQYYVMGRRDKNWKKYYENGVLFLTITYRNDDEIRINGIRIEK